MDPKYLPKLNEIAATLNYNSERGYYLEKALIHFLKEPRMDFDVKAEMKKIVNTDLDGVKERPRNNSSNLGTEAVVEHLEDYFKHQETVLNYNVQPDFALEYIRQYLKYDEIAREKIGFGISVVVNLVCTLVNIAVQKGTKLNAHDEVYEFKSGEELVDFSFVQIPSQRYIDNFSKCTIFNLQECMEKMPGASREDVEKALRTISISTDVDTLSNVSLLEKPILKINDATFQILRPSYLLRGLPQRCRILLRNCERFRETKGKTFEKVALNLLATIPRSKLHRNIKYCGGKYELDGILNFRESSWLVECSSHAPSLMALRGNPKSISNDLQKSIWKCEDQVYRAFENLQDPEIMRYAKRDRRGIIIIVDGVYPNLNFHKFWKRPVSDLSRYIVNYFDLRVMVSQPECWKFEEFLLWRTQRGMPIVAFDEADYWAFYFDRYKRNKEVRQAIESLKKNNSVMTYVSERFNDKRHYRYMAKTGQIWDPFP